MNDEQRLIEAVLSWWEEHEYDCVSDGEDEYNVYSEDPEFVKIAKELKGSE